jgi:FkbM family methyltransferase|tara:strand:- start:695 stop:1393 length:699 start_codon:yes stop_codon:yes gene_type:complete
MNYGSSFFINLRYLLSYLGILRIIKKFIAIFNIEYEKKYSEEILKNAHKSFHVWDVGANKGIYLSKLFQTKKAKSITAFEPTPSLLTFLKRKFSKLIKKKKLFICNYALADKNKKTYFWVSKKTHTENSLVYHPNKIKTVIEQKTPDELITKKKFKIPNLIKIDIEGGELKFLEGSKKMLKHKELQHLFIEVHFAKLNKLYGKNSVKKIIKILIKSNFKISWIDSSHLHAKK